MLAGKLRWFVIFSAVWMLVGTTADVGFAQEPAPVKSGNPLFDDSPPAKDPSQEKWRIGKTVLPRPLVLGMVRKVFNDNRAKNPAERRAEAEIVVTHIFYGPRKLSGQKFTTWSTAKLTGGHINPGDHSPLLEVGDMALLEFTSDDPDINAGILLARTHHLPENLEGYQFFPRYGIDDLIRRANYTAALRKVPDRDYVATFLKGLQSPEDWVINLTLEELVSSEYNPHTPADRKEERTAALAKLKTLFRTLSPLAVHELDKILCNRFQPEWPNDPARYELNISLLESGYDWDSNQLHRIYMSLFDFGNNVDGKLFRRTRERFQAALAEEDESGFKKTTILQSGLFYIWNKNHSNERRSQLVNDLITLLQNTKVAEEFEMALNTLRHNYDQPFDEWQLKALRELKIKPEVSEKSTFALDHAMKQLLEKQK